MEKQMDHDIETEMIQGFVGIRDVDRGIVRNIVRRVLVDLVITFCFPT